MNKTEYTHKSSLLLTVTCAHEYSACVWCVSIASTANTSQCVFTFRSSFIVRTLNGVRSSHVENGNANEMYLINGLIHTYHLLRVHNIVCCHHHQPPDSGHMRSWHDNSENATLTRIEKCANCFAYYMVSTTMCVRVIQRDANTLTSELMLLFRIQLSSFSVRTEPLQWFGDTHTVRDCAYILISIWKTQVRRRPINFVQRIFLLLFGCLYATVRHMLSQSFSAHLAPLALALPHWLILFQLINDSSFVKLIDTCGSKRFRSKLYDETHKRSV